MKTSDINYSIAGYSVTEDVASGLISAVVAFFERIQREREKINQRIELKRHAEKLIRQQTMGRLSLDERVRMGIWRY